MEDSSKSEGEPPSKKSKLNLKKPSEIKKETSSKNDTTGIFN